MTHARRTRSTKSSIRHLADIVAGVFRTRGAEIDGPTYRFDPDADRDGQHVFDILANYDTAAGEKVFDIFVYSGGVYVDDDVPNEDGYTVFEKYAFEEFFSLSGQSARHLTLH